MVFSSTTFLLAFLPLVAILYYICPRKLRNGLLLVFSLLFYGWGEPKYILIMLFSTVFDYCNGLAIGHFRSRGRAGGAKAVLVISVVGNLAILGFFKYTDFAISNLNGLLGTAIPALGLLLPIGISFYTFQTMSYAIDVYRRDVKPVRNLLDFGFYVSFFPQLVAGPIVRAAEFIPQLYQDFKLTRTQFGIAVFWILNGLAKKMLIGDYIAVNFIDRVFADPTRFTGFENLMALYGYSLQVYADFSGYTDIAIGVALLMGFTLPTNFNSPYKAASTAEFWKRWHMSLSTWLRDYLYIPMGGNRNATSFTYIMLGVISVALTLLTGWWWLPVIMLSLIALSVVLVRIFPALLLVITTDLNLMITMLIGGLWHGASWMFVIWGGLNGLGLIFYKFWKRISPWGKSAHWFARVQAIAITFTFITFTRIWFRSDSLETANKVLAQITGDFGWALIGPILWGFRSVFLIMLAGLIIHWLPETFKQRYRSGFAALPLWAMALTCIVVVLAIYQTMTAEMVPFIYFQF